MVKLAFVSGLNYGIPAKWMTPCILSGVLPSAWEWGMEGSKMEGQRLV
jgi:hypothetical protein